MLNPAVDLAFGPGNHVPQAQRPCWRCTPEEERKASLEIQTMEGEQHQAGGVRLRAYEVLEHGRRREPASRALDWLLVLLVVADVVATVAHTVPDVAAIYGSKLLLLDRFCVAVFAIEYIARL